MKLVKCPNCHWVHYIVENGHGFDRCFRCGQTAKSMKPASQKDVPIGCTIQSVNKRNFKNA